MMAERVIAAQKVYGWYYRSESFRWKNKFRQLNIFWEEDNSVLKVPPTKHRRIFPLADQNTPYTWEKQTDSGE